MSPAGEFMRSCGEREVQIVVDGKQVVLRGPLLALKELMPQLAPLHDEVHRLARTFLSAETAPLYAERH